MARGKATSETSHTDALDDEILALIFARVPAPDRLRCEEVCVRWKRVLRAHEEFCSCLKLPHDDDDAYLNTSDGWSATREEARDDALHAASVKARGRLRSLDVSGCGQITHAGVIRACENNAHLVNLCMFEGNASDYRLRLRPHHVVAIARALGERARASAYSTGAPRVVLSVEVTGFRELAALRKTLVEAALLSDAPPAPLQIHGAKVVIAGFTASLLFRSTESEIFTGSEDDSEDESNGAIREDNERIARKLVDVLETIGPRGLQRVNFGELSFPPGPRVHRHSATSALAIFETCTHALETLTEIHAHGGDMKTWDAFATFWRLAERVDRVVLRQAWKMHRAIGPFPGHLHSGDQFRLRCAKFEYPADRKMLRRALDMAEYALEVDLSRPPDGGRRLTRRSEAAAAPTWHEDLTKQLCVFLENRDALERLDISQIRMDASCLESVFRSLALSCRDAGGLGLRVLAVSGNGEAPSKPAGENIFDPAALKDVLEVNATTLVSLDVGATPRSLVMSAIRSAATLPLLHTLDLSGTPMRKSGAKSARKRPSKKGDDANDEEPPDSSSSRSIASVLGETLASPSCAIVRLYLVHCGVTAADLREATVGVLASEKLAEVALSYNSNLGDDGCEVLARWIRGDVKKTKRSRKHGLVRLELEACGIGDAGGIALASAVSQSARLRRLGLALNPGIRKAGRAALTEAANGRPGVWAKETAEDVPWNGSDTDEDGSSGDDEGYQSEDDGYFSGRRRDAEKSAWNLRK